jgi:hypothetical protein
MGPTPAKVGTIMTGIHRQPVLIPGPLDSGNSSASLEQWTWDQGEGVLIPDSLPGQA